MIGATVQRFTGAHDFSTETRSGTSRSIQTYSTLLSEV